MSRGYLNVLFLFESVSAESLHLAAGRRRNFAGSGTALVWPRAVLDTQNDCFSNFGLHVVELPVPSQIAICRSGSLCEKEIAGHLGLRTVLHGAVWQGSLNL